MAFTLDLAACSHPDEAQATATRLLEHPPQLPHNDYWAAHALVLLSACLMAAATDGTGAETILAWIAAADDGRPLEQLRTGPVPTWARECEAILAQDRNCVLFTARAAGQTCSQPRATSLADRPASTVTCNDPRNFWPNRRASSRSRAACGATTTACRHSVGQPRITQALARRREHDPLRSPRPGLPAFSSSTLRWPAAP